MPSVECQGLFLNEKILAVRLPRAANRANDLLLQFQHI